MMSEFSFNAVSRCHEMACLDDTRNLADSVRLSCWVLVYECAFESSLPVMAGWVDV